VPEPTRCDWSTDDPEMIAYHDEVWGVPQRDDRALFEFLTLEGAQAGLSWRTILHKRAGYVRAFDGFDAPVVAGYDEAKIAALLADPGIVRNRLKVRSTVNNAGIILELKREGVALSDYLWSFVDGRPIDNSATSMSGIPSVTPEATAMSKAMKKRGFRFVGPTVCYAFMQACGMVNDHVVDCFRYPQVSEG
jgi:DNA-3-methyladenine glycosylase I